MANNTKFICANCGKTHEQWPALAFASPTSYNVLSETMKQEIGELSSDFCIVRHPEHTDRFIRGTLTIKVIDHCDDLEYGVWVSLSEKSYQDYSENFAKPNYETKYFGWLSNDIPEYEISESIPTTVYTRSDHQRPEIVPHENSEHQLAQDYYHGITKAEAERRIADMIKVANDKVLKSVPLKPWWKLW